MVNDQISCCDQQQNPTYTHVQCRIAWCRQNFNYNVLGQQADFFVKTNNPLVDLTQRYWYDEGHTKRESRAKREGQQGV